MHKHHLSLALAGFWHILKLAAGYYILSSLLPNGITESQKILFLWFGSPALMVAGVFFFPYFKPERFAACLEPGRLIIGFDALLAVLIAAFTMLSPILQLENRLPGNFTTLVYLFCGIDVLINSLLLVLLSRIRFGSDSEA